MTARVWGVLLLLLFACSREAPPVVQAAASVPADDAPEDPPYAPDSVFRPETHRAEHAPLPKGAVLVDDPLVAADGQAYSHLGEAVAIDDDFAVAGAPYAEAGTKTDSGAAYVFARRGGRWSEGRKLVPPKPRPYDRFGASVAVEGDTIVVTADRHDAFAHDGGAAFVYVREGDRWLHDATLAPREPQPSAAFGLSSAIDANTLVVGAPGVAAAYVFERRGGRWIEQAVLRPEGTLQHCGFGHSVAVDGDAILVGANTTSDRMLLAGSAYVFRRDGDGAWKLETALRSPRDEATARFGTAVAIRGDVALIGASRATVGDLTRAGAAFVFERRGDWTPVAELTNAPPRSDEEFGRALALLPDGAIVGSQFGDAAGLNTGGAQLYARDGARWTRKAALLAQDRATTSEFAFAIAADDSDSIIGAPRRNTRVTASGGAYVFRVTP